MPFYEIGEENILQQFIRSDISRAFNILKIPAADL